MRELFSNAPVVPTRGGVGPCQDPGVDNVTCEIVRRYDALVVWRPSGRGHAEARKIPNASERTQLESRVAAIHRNGVPARESANDRRRMGATIAALFAGYPSQRNTNPQDIVTVYVSQLQDLPVWAVERACRSVINGEGEGISLDFAPSVARLRKMAQGEVGKSEVEVRTIKAVLSFVLAEESSSPTELQSARLRPMHPPKGALHQATISDKAGDIPEVTKTAAYNVNESFIRECKRSGSDPLTGVSPSLLRSIQRFSEE